MEEDTIDLIDYCRVVWKRKILIIAVMSIGLAVGIGLGIANLRLKPKTKVTYSANVMTNFDWYSPKYAHRHTPEEVRKWCEKLGLKNIFFDVSDSGISTRCIKHEIK